MKWSVLGEGPGGSRSLLGSGAGSVNLLTPAYIPSFSSFGDHEVERRSVAILKSLRGHVPDSALAFLFSAYDLHKGATGRPDGESDVASLLRSWPIWWLDNGGFEQASFGSSSWTETDYVAVVNRMNPPVAVAFEYVAVDASPQALREAIERSLRAADSLKAPGRSVVLLIRPHPGSNIPTLVRLGGLVDLLGSQELFDFVGIPEANLGPTLHARLDSITALRCELDRLESIKPLHVFGASDPTCLTAYTLAGADLFDGLNWSRYWIDFATGALRDKSLWESDSDEGPHDESNRETELAVHNLGGMQRWFTSLRDLATCKRGPLEQEVAIIEHLSARKERT